MADSNIFTVVLCPFLNTSIELHATMVDQLRYWFKDICICFMPPWSIGLGIGSKIFAFVSCHHGRLAWVFVQIYLHLLYWVHSIDFDIIVSFPNKIYILANKCMRIDILANDCMLFRLGLGQG